VNIARTGLFVIKVKLLKTYPAHGRNIPEIFYSFVKSKWMPETIENGAEPKSHTSRAK
jgi:hypothetical protein